MYLLYCKLPAEYGQKQQLEQPEKDKKKTKKQQQQNNFNVHMGIHLSQIQYLTSQIL